MDTEQSGSARARRLAVHYAVLALVTAGVVVFVFVSGACKHAQPQIAGGYDVLTAIGLPRAEDRTGAVGPFVTISNAQSTLSGSLSSSTGA